MERWIPGHLTAYYTAPAAANWTGRNSGPGQEGRYWHEHVDLRSWNEGPATPKHVALLGYACDAGVRRNQGRPGAAEGPDPIRQRLGRLAWHHGSKRVIDYGNVVCPGDELEAAQAQVAVTVEQLIAAGHFPLLLGGGHDLAYGHFSGVRAARPGERIGILNFDAHFDLRPVTDRPNSGTPFKQLLDEELTDYLVLGIQRRSNPAELFEIAAANGVEYVLAEHCRTYQLPTIIHLLEAFLSRNDQVYLTIDLDGFSAAYAPGVSAPSPFGFSPAFVEAVLEYVLDSGKVVAADVVEYNPTYDRDGLTARLAAGLVDRIVSGVVC